VERVLICIQQGREREEETKKEEKKGNRDIDGHLLSLCVCAL
jgi:hypothetical protein